MAMQKEWREVRLACFALWRSSSAMRVSGTPMRLLCSLSLSRALSWLSRGHSLARSASTFLSCSLSLPQPRNGDQTGKERILLTRHLPKYNNMITQDRSI